MLRSLIGTLLGFVVRMWLATLRIRVIDETSDATRASDRPWVLVFFHGTQVPLLAWKRRRRTAVLVSWSNDGALQSKVMTRAGMVVVRGSSSRGGARGLIELLRVVRRDTLDAAFAVDGPKGPYGSVQPGAAACARRVEGHLVPIGSACRRARVLARAWDRMALPWPFTRVVVVVGEALPIDPSPDAIADAIVGVNDRARAAVEGS